MSKNQLIFYKTGLNSSLLYYKFAHFLNLNSQIIDGTFPARN